MSEKDLVKYFIEHTDERFEKVDRKLDELFAFKWKVIGIAVTLSSIVSFVIEIAFKK